MTQQEKWDFLKSLEYARVYFTTGCSSQFSYNGSSIYFRHFNGQQTYSTYDRFYWSQEEDILKYMDNIVRIDKNMDGEYYPLWTIEEGFVKEGQSFIKLNGKYYSSTFLEKLLNSITEIRSNLNIINI